MWPLCIQEAIEQGAVDADFQRVSEAPRTPRKPRLMNREQRRAAVAGEFPTPDTHVDSPAVEPALPEMKDKDPERESP